MSDIIKMISLVAMVSAASLSGCDQDAKGTRDDVDVNADGNADGNDDGNDEGRSPQSTPFSLSIPADQWPASKYCGDTVPDIPKDPTPEYHFDKEFISGKLAGDGLNGWIHGAVPSYQQYIFTYRKEDPNDFMAFFTAEQFSLVPTTPEMAQTLATLRRHDKVRLKGTIFENGSPLTHIKLTSLELVKAYDKPTNNSYAFDLAQLKGQKTFSVFGQVHATVASKTLGMAVMLEYNDLVMPIAINPKHNDVAAKLYRGDIVNMAVKVVERPHGPQHFETDDAAAVGIEIIDPMLNCHGLAKTVTGYLAKFEKSPAISTDVYAVRVVDANGIGRNYTLFPGVEDQDRFMEIFMAVSAKAKAAWDADPTEPQVVRNFRKKEGVKVTVIGKLNVVSSEQANAQVYIDSADAVTFSVAD